MWKYWNQLILLALSCPVLGLTGCATMTSMGNSLMFWKKAPPQDQFATNPKSPSLSLTPTGSSTNHNAIGQNGMANGTTTKAGFPLTNTSPLGNTGPNGSSTLSQNRLGNQPAFQTNPTTAKPQNRLGQNNSFTTQNPMGTRPPYSTQMPGALKKSSPGTPNQLSHQPLARTASSSSFGTTKGSSGFAASTTAQASTTNQNGYNPQKTTNSGFGNSTPSSQFRNTSSGGFQPSPGTYIPNTTVSSSLNKTPSAGSLKTAQPSTSSTGTRYPTTRYPGFGSSGKSSLQPSQTNPSQPNSGFKAKNVTASANMTPPPSLPNNIFDKKGGYAPGSTGTSGTASQAGFETNTNRSPPPNGSKIPSTTDFYSPN